uniref:Ig-like domain-containing protein n=1 Tax=Acanthochromis polyacanthus TaxID=80966 RepID=A0A3Q1HHD6_9TELE
MTLLCWCIMSLCLSVYPGGSVTLKCSSEECPQLITGFAAMYLYHEHTGQEEVLYYSSGSESSDNIALRQRYNGRIRTTGSFMNHSITISNLAVDDTGLYSCVYVKQVKYKVKCNLKWLLCFSLNRLPCIKTVQYMSSYVQLSLFHYLFQEQTTDHLISTARPRRTCGQFSSNESHKNK